MNDNDKIGELIITDPIEPHAYKGRMEIKRAVIQDGVKVLPDYAFAECRNLTEVILPASIQELGKHTFYNCRSLQKLSIPAGLLSVGDGAFKNCLSLWKLAFYGIKEDEDQCVRKVLFDIEQEVELTLFYTEKEQTKTDQNTARLVMPQYDYQYVANEPARIFSEISYGTGHYYRKCINTSKIEFDVYDNLFDRSARENTVRTVSEQCIARLKFPYRLSEKAREQYTTYLSEHFDQVVTRLIQESAVKQESLEKLLWLGDFGVLNRERMPRAIEIAQEYQNTEVISWLMEYRSKHFQPAKKRFEL